MIPTVQRPKTYRSGAATEVQNELVIALVDPFIKTVLGYRDLSGHRHLVLIQQSCSLTIVGILCIPQCYITLPTLQTESRA